MDGELVAYGMRLSGTGLQGVARASPDWPRWSIAQSRARPGSDSSGLSIWDDRARIGMPGIGQILLDRTRSSIEFQAFEPWSAEALLHPGLSPAATVVAHWAGRTSLHASAIAIDGRAWAAIGDRGSGKSTLAALSGCPLVCDDLLITDGDSTFAGPSAIDLREGKHGGSALGRIGARERWRLDATPAEPELPLAGFVALEWSESNVAHEWIDRVGDRLALLDPHISLPVTSDRLLRIAALPLLRHRRSRDGRTMQKDVAEVIASVRRGVL